MTGYTRQSTADIIPTATVRAAPINAEYNAIRDAFAASGGHKHDGTTGEGEYVPLIADLDAVNKVVVDTANNRVSIYTEVSGASVEQVRFQDGAIVPVTDDDINLGATGAEFKDLYIDGVGYIDSVIITGGTIDGTVIGGTTPAAADFTTMDASGNASVGGTLTVTGTSTHATVDINGGAIDGTIIGASSAAAGSFTTVVTSGQATLASADINGGTVDGAVIGGTTAAAITGTTITSTTGITGDVTGDVTGNLTGNVTGNVTGNLTGNVTGNITAASGTSTVNNLTINGTLDVTGTTIANVVDPVNAQDAATKNYVDTSVAAVIDSAPGALDTLNELAAALGDDADFSTTVTNSLATKLPLAGGTMSGAIAMGDNKVTGVATPTSAADAATKGYTDTQDALKLNLTGGTLTGNLVMGGNKVTSTATPTADSDLTRKAYVDSILGSATSAATSAAAAATSATQAATSATSAGNSATAAATSASNASTSETNAANSATAAAAAATEAQGYADSINPDSIDINGGTIDGTVIGGSTPAAGSFTTGSFTGDVLFGDNDKAIFGAGSDLQIYHSGSHSYIADTGAGSLYIRASDFVSIQAADGTNSIVADTDSEVTLYHNGSPKLATTPTGIDVTGNVNFADNGKAIFGAGSDLQIYHDGSHSWVKDVGTGDLTVSGDNLYLEKGDGTKFLYGVSSTGQVRLYYGDDQKFITTSTGIDVTGTVTADGLTVAAPNVTFSGGNFLLNLEDTNAGGSTGVRTKNSLGNETTRIAADDGNDLSFYTTSSVTKRMEIGGNGDISFYEDTGTTPKFFWDASTERLGLGTTTPQGDLSISDGGAQGLEINANTSGDTRLFVYNRSTNAEAPMQIRASEVDFRLGGSNRMVVSSTGIDVTGTVTADGLTVDGDVLLNGDRDLHLVGTNPNAGTPFQYGEVTFGDSNTGQYNNHAKIVSKGNFANQTSLEFHTSDNNSSPLRMEISKIGDISFYEDTGTTPKFFWDASAESLGIGTVIPYSPLHLSTAGLTQARFESTGTSGSYVQFRDADTTAGQSAWIGSDGDLFKFYSNNNTLNMAMTTAGNVGIGTSSPAYKTVISANGASGIEFGPAYSGTSNLVQHYSRSGGVYVDAVVEAAQHRFHISGTEAMRIDSSGNLLVGKTAAGINTVGFEAVPSGYIAAVRDGGIAAYFQRKTSDGSIVEFRKDGTTVGSIGARSGDLYIASGDHGVRIRGAANEFIPTGAGGGTDSNGEVNLGGSGRAWKDLYLSGGVYLGGTGSANKLDDYEEGTWTATVQGVTTAGTATYGNRAATYTKVGNIVYVQCFINYSSFTGTGDMRVYGLPFLGESGSYETHPGSVHLQSISLPTGTVQVVARSQDGQAFIQLKVTKDNASEAIVQCDAAGQIEIGLTYRSA